MSISDNIIFVDGAPQGSMLADIAARVKKRRLELNLTQKALAARAGLKLPTYRRFERTGEISLRSLTMIAIALNAESDFDALFAKPSYRSIDDILENASANKRQRGSRDE